MKKGEIAGHDEMNESRGRDWRRPNNVTKIFKSPATGPKLTYSPSRLFADDSNSSSSPQKVYSHSKQFRGGYAKHVSRSRSGREEGTVGFPRTPTAMVICIGI